MIKKLFSFKYLAVAIAIGLAVSIVLSPFTVFAKECVQIRDNVVRLHIIPNSNSQIDQQIKLCVRDEMLKLTQELFSNAKSKSEAIAIANDNVDLIEEKVKNVISNHNISCNVKVETCSMFFKTREYSDFTMPAGRYDAVRIILGEGKGDNFWCVLYPMLCIPAATYKEKADDVFSSSQQQLLEGKSKYEIKFAAVELFEKLKNMLK